MTILMKKNVLPGGRPKPWSRPQLLSLRLSEYLGQMEFLTTAFALDRSEAARGSGVADAVHATAAIRSTKGNSRPFSL